MDLQSDRWRICDCADWKSPLLRQVMELLPSLHNADAADDPPELEIVFLPGPGKFSGQAQCNMLVVTDANASALRLAKQCTSWWPIANCGRR